MTAHNHPVTASIKAKLTVKDFLLLEESGAFANHCKTELIDGEIYYTNAQHRPHLMAKMHFHNALHALLSEIGSNLSSVVEGSVERGANDLPEPDLVLTSEPYGEGAIPAASVALAIEISDTTLRMDLGNKLGRYATAGIPEYWVFDVDRSILHQMWSPEGDQYVNRRTIQKGQTIAAETIADLRIGLPVR